MALIKGWLGQEYGMNLTLRRRDVAFFFVALRDMDTPIFPGNSALCCEMIDKGERMLLPQLCGDSLLKAGLLITGKKIVEHGYCAMRTIVHRHNTTRYLQGKSASIIGCMQTSFGTWYSTCNVLYLQKGFMQFYCTSQGSSLGPVLQVCIQNSQW